MEGLAVRQVRFLAKPLSKKILANNGINHLISSHHSSIRSFRSSTSKAAIIPYMLADIGEGITECQIIEWFVEPGSRVAQFDRICEVQSDKASVEITSRFDGVVKALHYLRDEMAIVGKPLIDIDIDGEAPKEPATEKEVEAVQADKQAADDIQKAVEPVDPQVRGDNTSRAQQPSSDFPSAAQLEGKRGAGIATPGVRQMIKDLKLNIYDVTGTGKDGRVRKEDIQQHLSASESSMQQTPPSPSPPLASREDQIIPLTPTETQMLKIMTRSLSIPHFLYTHAVDVTALNNLRTRANASRSTTLALFSPHEAAPKLSALPFIMKAISQTLVDFPKVNAHLDVTTDQAKPQLVLKASHNFGLAIDSPQGLLVPVVKDIQSHSIASLAVEINRLSNLAKAGRLSVEDFKGATLTISNIGSIGGGVVSPVIVPPMVAIIGVGRATKVPRFTTDTNDQDIIVKREEVVLSWSADHRILDGATVARCAERVASVLENIDALGVVLR